MADFTRLKVPDLKVDGAAIDADLSDALVDLRVQQTRALPDAFTIRFADPFFEILDGGKFGIGKVVEISFSDEDETTVVTKGEITAIGVEPGTGGRHDLVVSGLDKAHRLAGGTKVRTYQDVKDSDIVSTIAGEYGLSAQTDDSSQQHAYMVQNASDYDFLTERARAVGFDWWVDDTKLYFKKRAKAGGPKTLTWGDDLYRFKVRFSGVEAASDAEVRGWDPATQKAFKGSAKPKANAAALGSTAPAATAMAKDMKKIAGKRFAGPALALDQGEAKQMAASAVARGEADEAFARGEAEGEPGLKPGMEVKIENMGPKLSGNYFLTDVEHYYVAGDRYVTRFVAGGRDPAGLVDMLSRNGNGPHFGIGHNPMIGVVTNLADPDELARVKVKFPALSDEEESTWARVAAPGAGKERGLQLYPEIGDEVLVAFEHGDPRRPIVVGGLWSSKITPALKTAKAVASKKVETRGWYSRLGHKIEMKDGSGPGDKSITVELSDGSTILALKENKVSLDSPSDIAVTGDKKIDVKATGKITVDGQEITLKGLSKIVLDAPQIEIKASASLKLEGAKTDIKASAMLNADGGGMTQIKGGLLKLN